MNILRHIEKIVQKSVIHVYIYAFLSSWFCTQYGQGIQNIHPDFHDGHLKKLKKKEKEQKCCLTGDVLP